MDAWSSGASYLLTFIQGSRQALFLPLHVILSGTDSNPWLVTAGQSTPTQAHRLDQALG